MYIIGVFGKILVEKDKLVYKVVFESKIIFIC